MPPVMRAQLFFQDGAVGWSESYWNNSAASIDDLETRTVALAKKRMKLLGQGSTSLVPTAGPLLIYIRSEDLTTKNVKVLNGQEAIPQGFKERSTGQSEVPWSTVLLRYTFGDGANFYRSMRELSGVPDDIVVDPPGPRVSTDWFGNFNNWVSYIKSPANGWCFPHFVYTPIPGLTVLAVNRGPLGDLVLDFNALPAGSSPATFYARGFRPNQWNGQLTMRANLVPPGTSWTTLNKFYKAPPGPIAPGFLATRTFTLAQITNCIIRGETHRSRGRVFGQPRGRRPARVK